MESILVVVSYIVVFAFGCISGMFFTALCVAAGKEGEPDEG